MKDMSPLGLKILIHYRTQPHLPYAHDDLGHRWSDAVLALESLFLSEGMIVSRESEEDRYTLTGKGNYYLDYLCKTPFPTEKWEIVRDDETV